MPLTQAEFESILNDASKSIEGNLEWQPDPDHSPSVEFRAEVDSDAGHPLVVVGSYNRLVQALSYTLLHRESGRVYALDLGKDHRNPDGQLVGEKHKHRWTEKHRDKEAYDPPDITSGPSQPLQVWTQFCAEAKLTHKGTLRAPPPVAVEEFFP